jgi:hypothetical protein
VDSSGGLLDVTAKQRTFPQKESTRGRDCPGPRSTLVKVVEVVERDKTCWGALYIGLTSVVMAGRRVRYRETRGISG